MAEKKKTSQEIFLEEYKALCKKHGHTIVASPRWVLTEKGWVMTIDASVGDLPNEK